MWERGALLLLYRRRGSRWDAAVVASGDGKGEGTGIGDARVREKKGRRGEKELGSGPDPFFSFFCIFSFCFFSEFGRGEKK